MPGWDTIWHVPSFNKMRHICFFSLCHLFQNLPILAASLNHKCASHVQEVGYFDLKRNVDVNEDDNGKIWPSIPPLGGEQKAQISSEEFNARHHITCESALLNMAEPNSLTS